MGPVEVITSVERRRHWSAAQKQAMIEEAEEPGNTISMGWGTGTPFGFSHSALMIK